METEMTTTAGSLGPQVRCVLREEAIIGECPIWDVKGDCLHWIDIHKKTLFRFDPKTGENAKHVFPDILPCIGLRRKGGFILTLKKEIAFFDFNTKQLDIVARVESDKPSNRFNDGEVDPQGRFWTGTMETDNWKAASGHLYRVQTDLGVTSMVDGVMCSNGTGWSPDQRTMYHTDTFRYTIFAYDFDPATGNLSNRREFAKFNESEGGFPDGLTVDADGYVWSCLVGLGQIRRFDPSGRQERVVQLPVPRTTSCAFGGPGLKTLYVTTARETMTPEQIAQYPLSGSLFAVDFPGDSIQGQPANEFAG